MAASSAATVPVRGWTQAGNSTPSSSRPTEDTQNPPHHLDMSSRSQTPVDDPPVCFPHTTIPRPPSFNTSKPAERLIEIKLEELRKQKRKSEYLGYGRKRLPEDQLKRPRIDKYAPCLKLWGYKPVKPDLPQDIWREILINTDPPTVWKIRNVNQSFRFITSTERFWRENRKTIYEDDAPPKPEELSEFQFSDLLYGSGCQGCGAKKTKKAIWAFHRRWCDKCLKGNTIRVCISSNSFPYSLPLLIEYSVSSWIGAMAGQIIAFRT